MNISFSEKHLRFSGPGGILPVSDRDEVCRRLAMLILGECEGQGATQAAKQFHLSRQRYYQLRTAFEQQGALGLILEPRGPKTDYRRTEQIVRLVIRHRFLDTEAAAEVIAQKLRQDGHTISQRSVERIIADYGLQKKLYALNPAHPPQYVEVQRSRDKQRTSPADPASLERQVRQLLADKTSGNQVGIWLLLPEHLRLGTWDLLVRWGGQPPQRVEPRLGLHLVNESALCLCSYRHGRTLSQKGFELANGLPFVPTDQTLHHLLHSHTVGEAQQLQIALGKLRRAGHHFGGELLALDPHRMTSYTRRQMRRHRLNSKEKPMKMGQTFFLLDCQTAQPICFTLASSARLVAQATPELLRLAQEILSPPAHPTPKPLLLADKEHCSKDLFQAVRQQACFDLLCLQPAQPQSLKRWGKIPQARFAEHWPGYATATEPYHFRNDPDSVYHELVQRSGAEDFRYQGFLSTVLRPEVQALTYEYPQRWEVEEFFKFNQAMGWHRTGTLNLNIRYGQLTMALLAQAAVYQLRQRLGKPVADWDAMHLARHLFEGLEGDVRVKQDTIVVTLYNAPNVELLRGHYENLPDKLRHESVDPHIPWLYNFKLDFRFT